MSRIVAVEYVTLDGVFEEPQWSGPYFGPELQSFQYNNLIEADALLLGRVTYEGFSRAWPAMEAETGEFGAKMNAMPKYVATSTPDALTWNASALQAGAEAVSPSGSGDSSPVVDAVRALKADDATGALLVNGSSKLFNALAAAGLIDEIRLMVFPVVVGSGRPLWEAGRPPLPLTLTEARTTAEGVLIQTYVPAAAPRPAQPSS